MPTFQTVAKAEFEHLPARKATAGGESESLGAEVQAPQTRQTVGLAFSGGGIRSATFNLGILQGLAKAKLLARIDYLSTVSGGGFIGSWLISWIKRAQGGVGEVQEKLGDYENHRDDDGPVAEPRQVNFLRDYSNYLTPRLGVFGADTWTAIATYLRNVLLNQIILVSFLGAIVLLPWCVVRTGPWVGRHFPWLREGPQAVELAASIAVLLLLIGVCSASGQVARCSLTAKPAPKSASQLYVVLFTVVPVFASAIFALIALWMGEKELQDLKWYWWMASGAGLYGFAHCMGVICRQRAIISAKQTAAGLKRDQWIGIPLSAVVAGAVGGVLLQQIDKLVLLWKCWGHGFPHLMTWGPGLVVCAFLLTGTLHIGFLKVLILNEEQEWWGRTGGLLLLLGIAWTALFALAIFVPWLFKVWAGWWTTKAGLVAGWAITTAAGVLTGRSPRTNGEDEGGEGKDNSKDSAGSLSLKLIALVSPYVFLLGMLMLLSLGIYKLAEIQLNHEPTWKQYIQAENGNPGAKKMAVTLEARAGTSPNVNQTSCGRSAVSTDNGLTVAPGREYETSRERRWFWKRISLLPAPKLWGEVGLLLGVSLLVAWRVDINIFSMNLLYRNRLVRCYLGASRLDCLRHPDPFTGFDPRDEFSLAEFRKDAATLKDNKKGEAKKETGENPYNGPFPILCAALNITHGERLAWQERKAESFIFTPLYCGYQFSGMHPATKASDQGGFRDTEDYAYPRNPQDPFHAEIGGVHLGTAMSISGAAASPNMGFHTSPALAFLMTVFNVRLGWWLANPRYTNQQMSLGTPEGGPPCSLLYLFKELFASTSDRSDYVYLSDGGHFENLALYELVRRRCKYIIACDADADEGTTFGDLGNAIRKCRSDFGVEIVIDPTPTKIASGGGFAEAHGAWGKIRYPALDGEDSFVGQILYIKPTLTKETPRDVLAYHDKNKNFPDQTTADQWFDESQFESYRRLGLYSFDSLAGQGNPEDPAKVLTIEQLMPSQPGAQPAPPKG